VTDRGWTAKQPDETPVAELPLRPGTIRTLRAAGVLTLGELRAMSDRELLTLRVFGRGSLADVRSLVPPPGGSAGEEVTIGGRAFTLGAVYAPVAHLRPYSYDQRRLLPLRLVSYDPAYPWPGGRVEAEYVPSADNPRTPRRRMSGRAWAAWAGEPGGDVGR
jgi:hypothetical protein